MIEYNTKVWFRHITEFRKMDTLRVLWQELLIVGLFAGIIVFAKVHFLESLAETDKDASEKYLKVLRDTTIVHSVLGFVLSMLLVFRTNTAYDRWWEGRKLWGALVNTTRNLAIKYSTFVSTDHSGFNDSMSFIRLRLGDFGFALKEHLRGSDDRSELRSVSSNPALALSEQRHVPLAIISELYAETERLVSQNVLSGEAMLIVDTDLRALNDIMGGCERIRKTPIPFTYSLFLKKFIFFFILILPLGFAALFGYMAIPLTMFVFYVLVSLEIIAEEIEDPFGEDVNDLPTQQISQTIRKNVDEIFQAATD